MVANSLAVAAGVRAKSPHKVGARGAADGTITILARRENVWLWPRRELNQHHTPELSGRRARLGENRCRNAKATYNPSFRRHFAAAKLQSGCSVHIGKLGRQ